MLARTYWGVCMGLAGTWYVMCMACVPMCYAWVYIYILFFLLFSIIGYNKILNIVPCAIQ